MNWEKSALYGVNIDEDLVFSTANRLNCKPGNLPFNYLDLTLGGYPKKLFLAAYYRQSSS